jgi:hypothetical protein
MKALFTRKMGVSVCILLMAGLPWSCVDHVEPSVSVTCKCQIIDNIGPTGLYDTRTMDCPGGRHTCTCGGLQWRGQIIDFHCD